MRDISAAIGIGITIGLWTLIVGGFGYGLARDNIHRDLYERGLMVQCLGQIGYHWECEEPQP